MTNTINISEKRILLITSEFPPGPGGIGNHAYNLAKYLQAIEGLQVTVLADTYFTSLAELREFDSSQKYKIYRIYRSKIIIFTYLKRVLLAGRLMLNNDTIICSGKFSLWLAGLYKFFFRKKEFIAIAHGTELDLKNKLARSFTNYSLHKFEQVVSVSRYTQDHLPKAPKGQRRRVIPNGIDLAEKSGGTENKIEKTDNKPLQLLTVGNVTPRKGQKNVIRALPEIIKKYPNVQYHIVGLPTHKEVLSGFATDLNVLDNIIFHGKVSRQQLHEMYSGCDIFMMLSDHTSDGDFEGFGIAVLEANLWKKPAIGSRKSGIADAIDDYVTGVLVDQHNDKEIAEAIACVMNNYEAYSEKAYQWALQHDWERIAQRYYEAIS